MLPQITPKINSVAISLRSLWPLFFLFFRSIRETKTTAKSVCMCFEHFCIRKSCYRRNFEGGGGGGGAGVLSFLLVFFRLALKVFVICMVFTVLVFFVE